MCTGCGRQIPVEYNVCPHCGRPQNIQYGPQPSQQIEPVGSLLTVLLYIASLIIPFFGIIVGIIWLGAGADAERRNIGKMCLLLGVLCIVLWVIGSLIAAIWALHFAL